ncbi:MAG: SpoIID/LytB domain-containing protein [Acidimicrobiales bacterium]
MAGPGQALAAKAAALPAVQISGYGSGHGRGMGQWGAYGYASEYGWSYEQILSHFYGGTTLGALAGPEPDITVHLVELDGHNTIASAVGGGAVVATWAGTPLSAAAFEVARTGGTQDIFTGPGCAGPWQQVATTTATVTMVSSQPGVSGQGGTSPAQAAGVASSELQACIPGIGARTYQGALVAQPDGETDNVLPLEDYVDGVVPAESPVIWASQGGQAELEAQAVAARSYALAFVGTGGEICDTTACQMYTGLPDQYGPTADAEVAATAGQVLYCEAGTSCGPAGSIALAEYSASTGGYTSGGAFPAVPDLGDSVPTNPVHAWTADIAVSAIESAFPSVGSFLGIDVTKRNGLGQIGGRVEDLTVVGSAGSVTLTGDQFAADLGLRSNWFELGGSATVPPTSPTTTTVTTSTTSPPATTTTATTTPSGGTTTVPEPAPAGALPDVPLGPDDGYWVAGSRGDVTAFGAAASYGTAFGTSLAGQVRAMAATPDYQGYWLVGSKGGVLAFGDATWYGSASKLHLRRPIVGMAATPDGGGYWLVSSDGGVFAYGDARYYGSAGHFRIRKPIVGMAATPDGGGYWLVARGGGVFAFGDAGFYGSTATMHLDKPIMAIVPSAKGRGYFLVARDGGVFAFGDAKFTGSLPSEGIKGSVVAVTPTYDGGGYYVLTSSGKVYAFGDATMPHGVSPQGMTLSGRAVAIVAHRSPRSGLSDRRRPASPKRTSTKRTNNGNWRR